MSHWVKHVEEDEDGMLRKYYQHKDNAAFRQTAKPYSETHLIQAAIEGNLAFLEVYTKVKGDLLVCDQ